MDFEISIDWIYFSIYFNHYQCIIVLFNSETSTSSSYVHCDHLSTSSTYHSWLHHRVIWKQVDFGSMIKSFRLVISSFGKKVIKDSKNRMEPVSSKWKALQEPNQWTYCPVKICRAPFGTQQNMKFLRLFVLNSFFLFKFISKQILFSIGEQCFLHCNASNCDPRAIPRCLSHGLYWKVSCASLWTHFFVELEFGWQIILQCFVNRIVQEG